jgi:hypothetical protein
MAWYDDILGSGVNIFGAAPPSYLGGEGGLLNTAEMDKLKQKSLISGLLNTGLTYLAQPKNQRYGSALPYLAKAGIAGVGASQNVYDQASQDYITKAKIEELQAGKTYATQLLNDPRVKGKPELEMLARKDPAKLFDYLNPKAEVKEVNGQLVSYNPLDKTATSVFGTPKVDTVEVDRGDRIDLVNKSTGMLINSYPKSAAPQTKEMYEPKPIIDANGKTVYLPTVYGAKQNLPILDLQGKPVTDYAPARTKPLLPPAVQRAEDDDYEKISSANTIVRSTGDMINSFAKGEIPTSVIGKASAYLSSATGINANDPNVIAYKDYDRFKTKLVNESLRLNKGTQTEGDAVRAVRELNSAASSQDAISALTQLQWYNSQAIENASKNVLRRRTNSGLPAPEVMPEKPDIQALQIPAGVDGITVIKRLPPKFLEKAPVQLPSTSIQDAKLIYDALPKNARYVDIDQTTGQPIRNADGTFRIAVKQ